MASINPISTSFRMSLNLGVVNGKVKETAVTVAGIKNSLTADNAQTLIAALTPLLEYPVTSTKKYSTGLLSA